MYRITMYLTLQYEIWHVEIHIRGNESQRKRVLIKLQIGLQFFKNNVEQFNVKQHLKLLCYYW